MFARTHLTLFIVCIFILYQRDEAFTAGAGNIGDMGKRGFRHDKVARRLAKMCEIAKQACDTPKTKPWQLDKTKESLEK